MNPIFLDEVLVHKYIMSSKNLDQSVFEKNNKCFQRQLPRGALKVIIPLFRYFSCKSFCYRVTLQLFVGFNQKNMKSRLIFQNLHLVKDVELNIVEVIIEFL